MNILKQKCLKSHIALFILVFLFFTFGITINFDLCKDYKTNTNLLERSIVKIYASSVDLFDDVKIDDWFYKEVDWAVNNGITVGVEERKFAPNDICNNAQIITYLWRAFGEPTSNITNPFNNVSETEYYYQAVLWAYENGIITENYFNALDECTRLNAVTYLWRSAGSPVPAVKSSFADISAYSQPVDWAVEQNITKGYDENKFSPHTTCTRAQIVVFLYRDASFLNDSKVSNQTTNPEITTTDTLYNGLYKIAVNEGVYEVYVENGTIWPDSLFTFTHNDGTVYEGYLADNVFTGNCNISYPNGDSYNGDLYNNKKDGEGTYIWNNGDSYVGIWSNDKMNGEGTYFFANGSYIEGNFRNNQPVGLCNFYDINGVLYITEWKNGECINMEKVR